MMYYQFVVGMHIIGILKTCGRKHCTHRGCRFCRSHNPPPKATYLRGGKAAAVLPQTSPCEVITLQRLLCQHCFSDLNSLLQGSDSYGAFFGYFSGLWPDINLQLPPSAPRTKKPWRKERYTDVHDRKQRKALFSNCRHN